MNHRSATEPADLDPIVDPPSVPSTMPAAVARRYGTADVISVEEVSTPTAGNAEVLVRVHASSLNALDWHFLTGTPYLLRLIAGLRRPKRIIHGADVAGRFRPDRRARRSAQTGSSQ